MRRINDSTHLSIGTARNYEQCLVRVAEYVQAERLPGGLIDLTRELAIQYLEQRGQGVGQKTLDMERQSIQSMLRFASAEIQPGERLPVVKSEISQVLKSRAYTSAQVKLIAHAQTEKYGLATAIAHNAGLRAHELITLQPAGERSADPRPALASKFAGREGIRYTVTGKGGLTREVMIGHRLAALLEVRRLTEPLKIVDRGIFYQQHYGLGGGKKWSNSFSAASIRALGWSNGGHGVRHSYAQSRMAELQKQGLARERSLETVSQEMGHFRPEITETYLR